MHIYQDLQSLKPINLLAEHWYHYSRSRQTYRTMAIGHLPGRFWWTGLLSELSEQVNSEDGKTLWPLSSWIKIIWPRGRCWSCENQRSD